MAVINTQDDPTELEEQDQTWIDPYISHGTYSPGRYLVPTGIAE